MNHYSGTGVFAPLGLITLVQNWTKRSMILYYLDASAWAKRYYQEAWHPMGAYALKPKTRAEETP